MVDEDGICNPSKNQHLNEVVAARLSRRSVLKGGLAALALGGIGSLVKAIPAEARGRGSLLGFTGIPVSSADTIVVRSMSPPPNGRYIPARTASV